jgi:hypothetical protein
MGELLGRRKVVWMVQSFEEISKALMRVSLKECW